MSQTLPERRSSPDVRSWQPFRELDQIADRLRQMLDETFGGAAGQLTDERRGAWMPAVDVTEQDDGYLIEAELPGVKPEDIDIELVDDELSITGEARMEEQQGVPRRRVRRIGRFEYRMRMPGRVDPEKVQARLENGVLTVRVPKAEPAKRKRVEIGR